MLPQHSHRVVGSNETCGAECSYSDGGAAGFGAASGRRCRHPPARSRQPETQSFPYRTKPPALCAIGYLGSPRKASTRRLRLGRSSVDSSPTTRVTNSGGSIRTSSRFADPLVRGHVFSRHPNGARRHEERRRYQIGTLLRFAIRGTTDFFAGASNSKRNM